MENSSNRIVLHHLVLLGGGHAHVHVIKMMGMQPLPNVRVTVITRDVITPYSGMIPAYIAGVYTKEECHIDLFRLCTFANATLIHAEASNINCQEKLIYCKDGRPPIRYDTLSINVGITPYLAISSTSEATAITPVKPIDRFSNRWEDFLHRMSTTSIASLSADSLTVVAAAMKHVVIVGGGAGGVELSLAIHQRLLSLQIPHTVTIINRSDSIMSNHSLGVQQLIHEVLAEKKIVIVNNTEIVSTEEHFDDIAATSRGYLIARNGQKFIYDEAFWCTQVNEDNHYVMFFFFFFSENLSLFTLSIISAINNNRRLVIIGYELLDYL
jgi:selenide, water dikinase